MGAAADHFTGFLDSLTSSPDGGATDADLPTGCSCPGTTSTESCPPSPANHQPRCSWQRAAYRLLTARRPVLDAADEAGYGLHEAFTRAAARAYAVTPAAWQARPGRIQLDAPIHLSVDEDHQTIRTLLSRLVGQIGMWNAALGWGDPTRWVALMTH